jgi:hypothetical protein
MKPKKTWRSERVSDFRTATDKKIVAMILGAIRVDSPAEVEGQTTLLP